MMAWSIGDDHVDAAGLRRIPTQRMAGREIQVAFDRQAELATHGSDLGEADIAEFRFTQAKVAKAELCRTEDYVERRRRTLLI